MTTHAIELIDPIHAAHSLITPFQLSGVTHSFDVHSPSIAEYENEKISKIHFTAEEPPWDPSTNEIFRKRNSHVRSSRSN